VSTEKKKLRDDAENSTVVTTANSNHQQKRTKIFSASNLIIMQKNVFLNVTF